MRALLIGDRRPGSPFSEIAATFAQLLGEDGSCSLSIFGDWDLQRAAAESFPGHAIVYSVFRNREKHVEATGRTQPPNRTTVYLNGRFEIAIESCDVAIVIGPVDRTEGRIVDRAKKMHRPIIMIDNEVACTQLAKQCYNNLWVASTPEGAMQHITNLTASAE